MGLALSPKKCKFPNWFNTKKNMAFLENIQGHIDVERYGSTCLQDEKDHDNNHSTKVYNI